MQLGVFYFGRAQGALAAGLTIAAYLLFALGVPAFVPGTPPTAMAVAFNVTLFAIISTVLVYTFGSFRERMDALRAYCSVVEQSEAADAAARCRASAGPTSSRCSCAAFSRCTPASPSRWAATRSPAA